MSFSNPDDYPDLYNNPEYWVDSTHLSESGAEEVSPRIAIAVLKRMTEKQ